MITRDLDDTARLLLMDAPKCDLGEFFAGMNKIAHADQVDVVALWARYRGFDGRPPSHDVDTGRRR